MVKFTIFPEYSEELLVDTIMAILTKKYFCKFDISRWTCPFSAKGTFKGFSRDFHEIIQFLRKPSRMSREECF